VTTFQSISETDILPASCVNTSYANILCQLMPTILLRKNCPVVERHYRAHFHVSYPCFLCSAIDAKDLRRLVARSGHFGTERPKQVSIDEAEQEDAHESLHWTCGDGPTSADVEEQRAC
jgi:hypothetical protein